MRKWVIALATIVGLCGAVRADWATDYKAYMSDRAADRYTNANLKYKMREFVEKASLGDLQNIVIPDLWKDFKTKTEWVAVQFGSAGELYVAYTRLTKEAIKNNDQKTALTIWGKMGEIADAHRLPPMNDPQSGVYYRHGLGKLLCQAGYLTQEALDADVAARLRDCTVEFRLAYPDAPAGAQPTAEEMVAYAKSHSQTPESMPKTLFAMATAYANGQLAAKDYAASMKGIVITSVGRLNGMPENDPAREPLLRAISGVKTSLKQLQDIEGNL